MPLLSGETPSDGALPTGGNIRFKKCPLCGLEYPEEARTCGVDDSLLELWAYRPASRPSLGTPLFALQIMARYIGALVVSFFASFATFFLVGMLVFSVVDIFPDRLRDFEMVVGLLLVATVGFAGVLAGGFCLPRRSRVFGSVFLLLCGLIYCVYLLATMLPLSGSHGSLQFPAALFIPLASGGALAVAFFWRSLRNIPPGERRPAHEAIRLSASWPVNY